MYCRSCRKWFPNNILFCDICGKPLVKDLDIYGENFFNGDVQAFDYIYQNSYNWVAGEVRKMFSAIHQRWRTVFRKFIFSYIEKSNTMILAREVLVHGLMRWCETEFTIMEES